MEFTLTSEIGVEYVQHVGSDETVVRAARVSTGRDAEAATREKQEGLIRYLMTARHGTPFECGALTVRVHAPIKVFREWHRHRVGWSYNEESGRYKDLEPVFYVPPRERRLIRPMGLKSARPELATATDDEHEMVVEALRRGYEAAYAEYRYMLGLGVDRGLARDVLGVGIYSSCYCTANPRSLMHFLELRTDRERAARRSRPLWEIDVAATKVEAIFAEHWPLTHAAWDANGRQAP